MEIPIVDDYEPSSVLIKEVIYNIAGYLLSSFRKKSELLRATDGITSALFASLQCTVFDQKTQLDKDFPSGS